MIIYRKYKLRFGRLKKLAKKNIFKDFIFFPTPFFVGVITKRKLIPKILVIFQPMPFICDNACPYLYIRHRTLYYYLF